MRKPAGICYAQGRAASPSQNEIGRGNALEAAMIGIIRCMLALAALVAAPSTSALAAEQVDLLLALGEACNDTGEGRRTLEEVAPVALAAAEALFDSIADFLAEHQFAIEGVGHGLPRNIVFGGAEAAGQNHDPGMIQGRLHGICQQLPIVADDQLPAHFDAQRVQLIGDIQRIGVDAL